MGIIEKPDEDVYEYGLELLLHTILNISAIFGTAAILGMLPESFVLVAVTLPLQSFGGGYHAKTHLRCFLIMYIGWWALIFILPFITLISAIVIACAAVLIVFKLAPVPHENVKMSVGQKLKMRKFARIIVSIWAILSVFSIFYVDNDLGITISAGLGALSTSMITAHIKNTSMVKHALLFIKSLFMRIKYRSQNNKF